MTAIRRAIAGFMVLVLCVLCLGGCGGGLLGSVLKITGAAALVSDDWSHRGGLVRILADITGYSLIERAIALVKNEATHEVIEVVLVQTAAGTFEGAYVAEENSDPIDPTEYTVVVTATDTTGDTAASEPVEFEVPPPAEEGAGE